MDLEEIGIRSGNWVDSAQDRNYWRALVNATLNLRVPEAMELVIYMYVYILRLQPIEGQGLLTYIHMN